MKFRLINEPNRNYSIATQIFVNRGIPVKEIPHYMNLSDADINEPEAFGEELMDATAKCFLSHFNNKDKMCMIVDCDCDGYTSSAIFINYLYNLNPDFVDNCLYYYIHEGKQHGLSDCMNWVWDIGPKLVVAIDSGTNDLEQLRELEDNNIDVIVLDHHEIESLDFWRTIRHPHLYLISSQSPKYPNHDLAGAGVSWQFCRYLDKILGEHHADKYLDLVALGLTGDMMNLTSCETRWLITKGLDSPNIKNPFIYGMWQKNKFKLGEKLTAIGVAFYIVPFINAICRSGTQEEKELVFESMLKHKAFMEVNSTKRGHSLGDRESIITQAIRTATNVKARQTKEEQSMMETLETRIKEQNLLDHKVILFTMKPGEIKKEIAGLAANRLMAKYQRPVCILSLDENNNYSGSARGCEKVDVKNFKEICSSTGLTNWVIGHSSAFGLSLGEENIPEFLNKTDLVLKDMPSEPVYYVDFLFHTDTIDEQVIKDIDELSDYWGQAVSEPLIAITNIEVTKDMISLMKSNTLKIVLKNGISLIKFNLPDEEYDELYPGEGYKTIDVIGRASINRWNGMEFPQIMIEDYEIKNTCAYIF